MKIGKRIARLRALYGESLREAALRTGISHTTIARIEKGEVVTSFNRTIKMIADGYGVSLEYLLTGRQLTGGTEELLRLRTLEEYPQAEQLAPELDRYIKLVLRAAELRICPNMLDSAIDLLAGTDPHLNPIGSRESLN